MPPRVVITRRLPREVEDRARGLFDVILNEGDQPLGHDDLLARMDGADALLPCVADPLPADLINALPSSIKVIANFGVGLDHLDLPAAHARGMTVTNTPGVLTEATADLAMLLLLGAARRAKEGMAQIANRAWPGWSPTHLLGTSLSGKRLGIVGMGRIGSAVANRARAFGMEIHGHSRTTPRDLSDLTYHDKLEDLLPHCDVLMLCCAATPETRHMIGKNELALLPPGAILINPARGDLVVDADVEAALERGQLAAAGLDVFEGEPALHPAYRDLPQVFALPHLGSATVETRTAMGMLALDNLEAFFAGRTPPNLVT